MNGKNAAWHRWLFFFRSLVFQAGKNTSSRWDAGKLASGRLKYGDPEQSLLNLTDPRRFNQHIKMLFILSYLFTYLCCQMGRIFFFSVECLYDRDRKRERATESVEREQWMSRCYLFSLEQWKITRRITNSVSPRPPDEWKHFEGQTDQSSVCHTTEDIHHPAAVTHSHTLPLCLSHKYSHANSHSGRGVNRTAPIQWKEKCVVCTFMI